MRGDTERGFCDVSKEGEAVKFNDGRAMSPYDQLRAERERFKKALEIIAGGYRDEILGLSEMPRRANRKYMMGVARAALQIRRKEDQP
jgi:hypothetical protein